MKISIATTSMADLATAFNQCGNIAEAVKFNDEHEDDVAGIIMASVPDPTPQNICNKFRKELGCPIPASITVKISHTIDRIKLASVRRPAKISGSTTAYHG